ELMQHLRRCHFIQTCRRGNWTTNIMTTMILIQTRIVTLKKKIARLDAAEQNRRDGIKHGLKILRNVLSSLQNAKKPTNVDILKCTIRIIWKLKRRIPKLKERVVYVKKKVQAIEAFIKKM
ncbi:hypothetical protein HN011_010514, partial [Eciton burchellii]